MPARPTSSYSSVTLYGLDGRSRVRASTLASMAPPRPFYYLENFCTALSWLRRRYGDLLTQEELQLMDALRELPRPSSGLLVRMIGRKGELFRSRKLQYEEIGCPHRAMQALIRLGWVNDRPTLSWVEVSRLLRKAERLQLPRTGTTEPRTLAQWWPDAPDTVYRVTIKALCERLRLMFFGNFRQDWSQFVLTDLGVFKYESVPLDEASRAFQTREHVETFHALFRCHQQLEEGGETIDLDALAEDVPAAVVDHEWLESRRAKLQFRIAQCYERRHDWARALQLYQRCAYPGARVRVIRLLERLDRGAEAASMASLLLQNPADDVEGQQLARMWPRLQRRAGGPAQRKVRSRDWSTFELVLRPHPDCPRVERAAAQALSQPDAPVHYVENGLINSLFGLLCWTAIFAPVPGAFFHEFQAAPADLLAPQFHSRRQEHFAQCLAQLDSGAYRDTMRHHFQHKQGIQSPFVYWGLLTGELLERALSCLPAAHLKLCFERLVSNPRANRAGLPDLVQFWPAAGRYRLIEIKGPGDRLQDNQIRWLQFFALHGMPASVCHVRWSPASAA